MFLDVKSWVKSLVKQDTALFFLLSYILNFRNRHWRPALINSFESILTSYSRSKQSDVFFIQIGANDGSSLNDPCAYGVRYMNWRGVLVEPVPDNFNRLVKNYELYSGKLLFEQVAIAHQSGSATFYQVGNSRDINLPRWITELSSFDRDIILKHKDVYPEIESCIVPIEVNTLTFGDLLLKYNIQTCDLILVDTEGYDASVLEMIDLEKLKPEIIIFEHKHLSPQMHKWCIQHLRQNKFRLWSNGADTLAVAESALHLIALPPTSWFKK